MRLKHLTLQGFKTFAPKTELLFGEGLTAIVGPNGSGKSNVADAVRWVLGEQSLLNLRAKRTEDLIFAGSSSRAPVGMAEVSLTLDNTDHLLPLEFSEITLTRRAYRSGENEYYLNRSRVRLKDIQEIAAVLGEAYTVVGQGMVDAALSLKPEERRELFEEAAEIRGYFVQRVDALRRLSRTEENTTRINDLLTELEPQVRRMERQARQAEDYSKLKLELLALLSRWYDARWAAALHELDEAARAEGSAEAQVARLKEDVTCAHAALLAARSRGGELREQLAALHRERLDVNQRHARAGGTLAVIEERIVAANLRRAALLFEHDALDRSEAAFAVERRAVEEESGDHSAEIERLEAENKGVESQIALLDQEVAEANRTLQTASAEHERLQRSVLSCETRIADAARKIAEGQQSVADAESALSWVRQQLEAETASGARLADEAALKHEATQAAEKAKRDAAARLADAQSAQAATEVDRRELGRRDDALHTREARQDAERQAWLYGGVRAVSAAARDEKLSGVRGTVAELLLVPAELEVALEGALGGRLQEVVVERWADAEAAIAFLKQQGAGRATFLPLDTLRSPNSPAPPAGEGILGVASRLVSYDPSLSPLAQSILGRLLIVSSLAVARQVISTLPAGAPWTLATLEGEVVRPGGSVTGGSHARPTEQGRRSGTVLSRERQLRELAKARAELRAALAEADSALESTNRSVVEQQETLRVSTDTSRVAQEQAATARLACAEGEAAVRRMEKELEWHAGQLISAKAQVEAATTLHARLLVEKANAERALGPAEAQVTTAEEERQRAQEQRATFAATISDSRTRLAVLAEAGRNRHVRRRDLEGRVATLHARQAELQARLAETEQETARLQVQQSETESDLAKLVSGMASLDAALAPAEAAARDHDASTASEEERHTALSGALLEAETHHSRLSVRREYCAGSLDTLWIEIVNELRALSADDGQNRVDLDDDSSDGVEPELFESPDQPIPDWRASPGGPATALTLLGVSLGEEDAPGQAHSQPGGEALQRGAGLERRIHALRTRLSRIGPVNPLAGQEHNALVTRHDYLQGQLTDLLSAAEHLKRIITALDRAMGERFVETFHQVNEAFRHFFALLFGGGSARLELTDPRDLSQTGIEISAQPPGKRMQPLAALSGGERALTSAALLFALLKVRPVPFCVLDEVDAALDESNVVRFRDALRELGHKTQFVIVTHNRGTIEVASTLYGVSMAGDGTSKLLSLKVG